MENDSAISLVEQVKFLLNSNEWTAPVPSAYFSAASLNQDMRDNGKCHTEVVTSVPC